VEPSETAATPKPPPRFEDYPLTRVEYITVMVHFYRGEIYRSTVWRQRLDATTNWAVLTTAGMLSIAFSSPDVPHILVLLSSLVVLAYLSIEARRYRYFSVYNARVRMIEENFLIPVITRQLESPMAYWRDLMAKDLDLPRYKTTFLQALGFRLRRNYIWIFLILLGGWLVKLTVHPRLADSWREVWERAAVGHVPPGLVLAVTVGFYCCLGLAVWLGRHVKGAEPEEEIQGLERNLDQWKL
jgi:uncharacterized membrane protein